MKILNWKTTLAGVLGGVVLCVVQAYMTGSVDLKTLALAATVAALGILASDSNVEQFVKDSPVAEGALDVADLIASKVADANASNPLFTTIHEKLDELKANVAAAPAATAALMPAPAPQINVNEAAPAAEAIDSSAAPAQEAAIDTNDPANWKFDPLTGLPKKA